MSSKNTAREFDVPAYYHVYNRGAGKRKIFLDAVDKSKFMSLLARYLDENDDSVRSDGVLYEKSTAKLVAYCLMGNHFHLLIYQDEDTDSVRKLVNSVSISYSMYFNLRHKGSGRLFEGPFKAARINEDAYFEHITRYIHMNPRTYKTYKWSSLPEYLGKRPTSWVHPAQVNNLTPTQYLKFLEDYEERKSELKNIAKLIGL
jgi:REP element-mobilizing transposase RayT